MIDHYLDFTYLRYPSSIIVLSLNHRSFDQLNMSNHSLPVWGTDPPFSHKSVVWITDKQNIICSKTLICSQLSAGQVVTSWPIKRKEKIHWMIIMIVDFLKQQLPNPERNSTICFHTYLWYIRSNMFRQLAITKPTLPRTVRYQEPPKNKMENTIIL